MITRSLIKIAATLVTVVSAAIDPSIFKSDDVIRRDIAIIGGGASGAHAAVQLKKDFSKSVVIVEKQSLLGGHVNTFVDKDTGNNHDYGVQVFFPFQNALDFFGKVNVTIYESPPYPVTTTRYIDFATGKEVAYPAPDREQGLKAVRKLLDLLVEKGYDKMIEPGYWNLPPGDKIPEDLLLPVKDLVKKYDIEPILSMMYPSTGGGAGSRGDFENLMTLTLLKSFPPSWIRVFLGDTKKFRVEGGNQKLYDRISDILGSDVVYDTVVIDSERDDSGIKLVVEGKNGKKKLIAAKKLLVATHPSRESLKPFGLNDAETKVFSKSKYGRSHTAIVSHSQLTPGTTLRNIPTSAIQRPLAPFLQTPFVMSFGSYGNSSKLFSMGASGSNYTAFDIPAAQALAQTYLERMAATGVLPDLKGEKLRFVAWSDHEYGGYGASPDDMRAGWMADLYALQGKRSTWFTGGGVASDFTTMLWKYNDDLLSRMVWDM